MSDKAIQVSLSNLMLVLRPLTTTFLHKSIIKSFQEFKVIGRISTIIKVVHNQVYFKEKDKNN